MPNQSHFSRPVKKLRPEDHEFRVRRPPQVVAKAVQLGNQPAGSYFASVAKKFFVIEHVQVKGRRR